MGRLKDLELRRHKSELQIRQSANEKLKKMEADRNEELDARPVPQDQDLMAMLRKTGAWKPFFDGGESPRRRLTGSEVADSAPHRRLVVLEKLLEDIKSANRNRDH